MTDFWLSCGHHLLDRGAGGGLVVTDDFLKVYLARPELVPPEEACPAERGLYASLLAEPRRPVTQVEITAIADADARENWQLFVAFRDHLLSHPTLEAAYAALARDGAHRVPTLFIWGDADDTVGRMAAEGTAEFIAAPYRFAALQGVGHYAADQVPAQVNALLLDHIAGNPA